MQNGVGGPTLSLRLEYIRPLELDPVTGVSALHFTVFKSFLGRSHLDKHVHAETQNVRLY